MGETVAKQAVSMTKAALIEALNRDLAKEYAALVQYVHHGTTIGGADELIAHSHAEHAHALALAEQIVRLGGIPSGDVDDIYLSPDRRVMLEQDLAAELEAVDRYRERIAQAEMLGEQALRRALEAIVSAKEEHPRGLQGALGR